MLYSKVNVNIEIIFLGDWRISADERIKYDSYFQQCSPTQGYVTGMIEWKFYVRKFLAIFF
jgi:hypothetical protein